MSFIIAFISKLPTFAAGRRLVTPNGIRIVHPFHPNLPRSLPDPHLDSGENPPDLAYYPAFDQKGGPGGL